MITMIHDGTPDFFCLIAMRTSILIGVATLSRLWLKYAVKEIKIRNQEILMNFIENYRMGPLLTISNHISTLDDPLIWGALLSNKQIFDLIKKEQMRWTLGAEELTFTNPFTSWFFTHGQVIPIFRGKGIFQPAMDRALELLKMDKWLHFFPEGRVIQENDQPDNSELEPLMIGRLKWGIGRLLIECKKNVTIVPMILKGFDRMKPNDRIFPLLNQELEINIGNPINSHDIIKKLDHIIDEDLKRVNLTQHIQQILNETKMIK